MFCQYAKIICARIYELFNCAKIKGTRYLMGLIDFSYVYVLYTKFVLNFDSMLYVILKKRV